MKIKYAVNPLETSVILDEAEKVKLYQALYEDELCYARDTITNFQITEAFRERISTLHKSLIENLEILDHYGDCVAVASTCSKCFAETLLEIDTIPGLSKMEAYYIKKIYEDYNPDTIEHAIKILETYEPTATWEGWEKHAPRWTREARSAGRWLQDVHLPRYNQSLL